MTEGAESAGGQEQEFFTLDWIANAGNREEAWVAITGYSGFPWPEDISVADKVKALREATRNSGVSETAEQAVVAVAAGRRDDEAIWAVWEVINTTFTYFGINSEPEEETITPPPPPVEVPAVLQGVGESPRRSLQVVPAPTVTVLPPIDKTAAPADILLAVRSRETDKDRVEKESRLAFVRESAAAAKQHRTGLTAQAQGLRPHQPEVVLKQDDFLADSTADSALNAAATNEGKTVYAAKAFVDGGAGQTPPGSDTPIRGMFITPSRIGIRQASDSEGLDKGLPKFAPELKVSRYYAEEKDLTGDVVVITDVSLLALAKEDPERFAQLDRETTILAIDEGHEVLGPLSTPFLRRFKDGKKTTVLTATPELGDGRDVLSELELDREIHRRSSLDAVELGIANGVQIFAISSGMELVVESDEPELTERDLVPLIADTMEARRRNETILSVLNTLQKAVRPTVIAAVRGNNQQHARDLADMARELPEYDDHGQPTGRNLRVEPLGSFRTDTQNDRALRAWHAGKVHALISVDFLKYAMDSDRIAGVIDTAQRYSLKDETQIAGRAARLKGPMSVLVNIVDIVRGNRRRIVGFRDVYEITDFSQGMVIGAQPEIAANVQNVPRRRRSPRGQTFGTLRSYQGAPNQPGRINLGDFDPAVQQAAALMTGVLLDELTVGGIRYGEPPDDWQRFTEVDLDMRAQGFSENTIRSTAKKAMAAAGLQAVDGPTGLWVPPNLNEIMAAEPRNFFEGTTHMSLSLLRSVLGCSRSNMETMLADLKITASEGRVEGGKGKPGQTVTMNEVMQLVDYRTKRFPPMREGIDTELKEIAERVVNRTGRTKVTTGEVATGIRLITNLPGGLFYERYGSDGYKRMCVPEPIADAVVAAVAMKAKRITWPDAVDASSLLASLSPETADPAESDPLTFVVARVPTMTHEEATVITRYLKYFGAGMTTAPPELSVFVRRKLLLALERGRDRMDPQEATVLETIFSHDPKTAALSMMANEHLIIANDDPSVPMPRRLANAFGGRAAELIKKLVE
jgi:superfamily II DNA or RNA helicase